VKNQVAPTCTQSGYSGDHYCTVCGYQSVTGTELAATGHTPVVDPAIAATNKGNIKFRFVGEFRICAGQSLLLEEKVPRRGG